MMTQLRPQRLIDYKEKTYVLPYRFPMLWLIPPAPVDHAFHVATGVKLCLWRHNAPCDHEWAHHWQPTGARAIQRCVKFWKHATLPCSPSYVTIGAMLDNMARCEPLGRPWRRMYPRNAPIMPAYRDLQDALAPDQDSSEMDHLQGIQLHDLIIRDNIKGVESLIRRGIDLNRAINFSHTVSGVERRLISRDVRVLPLHVSCIYRRPRMIELLLKSGANPNQRDYMNRLPLHLALVYWPRIPLIDDDKNLTKNERRYQTYLRQQHERAAKAVQHLCNHGAWVDAIVTEDKDHLLHLAARYGLDEAIRLLCRYGASCGCRDTLDRTPLHIAVQTGSYSAVRVLLQCGSDIESRDREGRTVLHYLCHRQDLQALSVFPCLLRAGSNINAPDRRWNTPLHLAAAEGQEGIMHALLQAGAKTGRYNVDGRIPLYHVLNNPANERCHYGIELLYQETLYHNVIDALGRIPHMLRQGPWAHLRARLIWASQRPPPLTRMCRQVIRERLGPQRFRSAAVNLLPCPPGIKNLIRYNVCEWWRSVCLLKPEPSRMEIQQITEQWQSFWY